MKEDLMFGHMGNGISICNRNKVRNHDYLKVAHISYDRSITVYDPELSDDAKTEIEFYAAVANTTVSATQSDRVLRPLTEEEAKNQINSVFIHEMDLNLRLFDIYNKDTIDPEIIQKCLDHQRKNPLFESTKDWIGACLYKNGSYYIEGLRDKILNNYLYSEVHHYVNDWLAIDGNKKTIRNAIELFDISNPIREMVSRTVLFSRVTRLSNYDGLNSHAGMNRTYFYGEYLQQVIDLLNLNPIKVRMSLNKYGFITTGKWPDIPERDGEEAVDYEDFSEEIINRYCHSMFVFLGIPVQQLYYNEFKPFKSIKIPKGNFCGFFGNQEGGGSILEMKLKKDLTVPVKTTETDYDRFELIVDAPKCGVGYCISETYDIHHATWGDTFELIY